MISRHMTPAERNKYSHLSEKDRIIAIATDVIQEDRRFVQANTVTLKTGVFETAPSDGKKVFMLQGDQYVEMPKGTFKDEE